MIHVRAEAKLNLSDVVANRKEFYMNKEQELLLAEIIVKVSAMERLLTKSGVITAEDLTGEMKKISEEVVAFIRANGISSKN